jgi:hypothetical protein
MGSNDPMDLDLVVDLEGLDDPDATRVRSLDDAAGPGIFVFEPESDAATDALKRTGLKVQRATMGSEMMAAAQKRSLQAVIVAPGADPELRELFMRAFKGKFAHVPVIYLSELYDDPKEQAQYRYEGAVACLPWPLPPARDVLAALGQLTQSAIEVESDLIVEPGSDGEKAELDVLKRKVAALEGRKRPDPAAAARVKQEAARAQEHQREATSLRSELTLVRERSQMLQDRIDRLINDLASVTKERDEVKLRLQKKASDPTAPVVRETDVVKSLRKIGQSADSFVWGLEQAIQFFEELQFEAGDKRAPSLKGHVRSLKLVRALLERIRDRLHEL